MPARFELCLQQRDRAKLGVALEDHPDSRRLGFADDQLTFPDVVAERHLAAHPHALGLRRDLAGVTDSSVRMHGTRVPTRGGSGYAPPTAITICRSPPPGSARNSLLGGPVR